jgi:hypothetical protein
LQSGVRSRRNHQRFFRTVTFVSSPGPLTNRVEASP